MTRAAALALAAWAVLLLPCTAAAAEAGAQPGPPAEALDVRFLAPAQAHGGLGLRGLQWALLVFDPAAPSGVTVDAPSGGTAATHQQMHASLPAGLGEEAVPLASRSASLPAGFAADAAFGPGRWAALFI